MKVLFRPYHNQSFLHFSRNLVSLCVEENFSSLVEDNFVFKQVKLECDQYQKRLSLPTYSGKGEDLQKLDRQRMQIYVSLKQQLKGISKLVESENATLAKQILALFPKKEKFAGNLNYGKKSELIDQTLKALSPTSLNGTLTKLNLVITINELTKIEKAFQDLYFEQNKINADLRSLKKATILRKELEKSIQLFYQNVEFRQHETGWKDLYAEMVQLYRSLQNSTHNMPEKGEHSGEHSGENSGENSPKPDKPSESA